MCLEEYKGVYVFAQQVDHQLGRISFELLGKARELASDLGTDVTAVLIGSGVRQMADELAEYGADRVIVVDNPVLKEYMTEPYAHALSSVINKYKPEIVLVGATAIGRDLGPRVSARVATGLTADCTKLEIGDFPLKAVEGKEQKHNQLLMTRPAFGGNTIATIACPNHRPQMATVRPGVMQAIERKPGARAVVEEYDPGFTPNHKYVEILDIVKSVAESADIMDARSWYQEAGGLAVRRILPCWRNWLTHWAGRSAAHGQWWMQAGNQRICRWDRPVRRSGQLYILPSVSPVRSSTWPEWRSQIS